MSKDNKDNMKELIKVTYDTETKQITVEINSGFMPMVTYGHKLAELEIDKKILEGMAEADLKKATSPIITDGIINKKNFNKFLRRSK